MEKNLSHSRQPNRHSKKIFNNVDLAPKYDDIFGVPPKYGLQTLSPRVEDYIEIFSSFHASRASSIPVLDLPVMDEAEVSFDVQSSSFDYAEVFGGFNGLDLAVSYEELVFEESKGGDEFSSEEAWTPAETASLSEESDHSGKNQSLSNGDSYQFFDGITEFSISYHKATRSSEDLSSGMTHITQLHDIPGFTCVVDQFAPSQRTEDENTSLRVTDDSNLNLDFSGGTMKGKHLRKTVSHPPNGSACRQKFGNDVKPQSGYNKNGSCHNEMFISVSEINLRTQPSQLPPPSRAPPEKGDSSRLSLNCSANASEGTAGDSSPPFFDVEVDATSSAAASAAAMKEAMVKAQAKLKSAKELMERKKEGLQSRARPGLKTDIKDKEGKLSKVIDGSNSLKAGGQQTVLESLEREKLLDEAKKSSDQKHRKESWSPQEFVKFVGADEWEEATQFFELVTTDKSIKAFEQANNKKFLVLNTKTPECGQKEKNTAMESFKQHVDDDKNLKVVIEDYQLETYENKLNLEKESCEQEENNGRLRAAKEAHRHKEHEKKVKVTQEVCEQEENEKRFRMVQQPVEFGNKLTGSDESEKHENLVQLQQKENKIEVQQAIKYKENVQKLNEANERIKNEKKLREYHERDDNGKRQKEALEKEGEEKLKEALELTEDEKRLKEVLEQEERQMLRDVIGQDENEKQHNEARKREENEKILKEALGVTENEKRLKEALQQEENKKRQKETLAQEEKDKNLKEVREREETEMGLKEAHERRQKENIVKDSFEKEEIEKSQKGAREIESNSDTVKQVPEKEESESRSREACEQEAKNTSKEAGELEETKKKFKDAGERVELEETKKKFQDAGERVELKGVKAEREGRLKFAKGISVNVEDIRTSDETCKLDDNKNPQATQLTYEHEEKSGKMEATEDALAHEDRKIRGSGKESEPDEMANVLVDERSKASGMAQGDLELKKNQFRMEGTTEPIILHDSMNKSGATGIGTGQTCVEQRKTASEKDSDPENKDRKFAHEWGNCDKNIKQGHVALKREENKEIFEHVREAEAAQPAVLEGKRNVQKTARLVNTNQSSERKEKNLNETLVSEEKERIKREREMEKERLRKIEEEREREREREREKDRMSVDRATLEARERAYSEARERAEKAAMERASFEARQRVLTEARERLERACAEAKEKSLADKAIMEAKLRAERAAVERATAEARERAVEKAVAEKAAAEARERVERSRTRQSSPPSDQGDLQPPSMGLSNGSKYPYSSVYGATYYTERPEGVEGESAQRCKARLERHRRTAERAAKALAEKNMRDLLAQREQAERNRSAETLDADVKRWSSGKEGNLRALLSTLQYILGPDSGWQSIPLTEVITAAAVKKAYRKATLCVHPDKLQQRGASIQQKYLCEKVFDLLKEAWNRFNSEER